MAGYMLTTVDNPYDPHTQFDEWYAWDMAQGYHTLALLGRVVRTSTDLSEAQQDLDVANAIDEIVKENVLGLYRKAEAPTSVNS